jgi:hypothetical protein
MINIKLPMLQYSNYQSNTCCLPEQFMNASPWPQRRNGGDLSIDLIGLVGLIGLLGLIGLKHKIPKDVPGGQVRIWGVLGLVGLLGFWNPVYGAAGAFGALGVWGHPEQKFARLAPLGLLGLIAPVCWLVGWA